MFSIKIQDKSGMHIGDRINIDVPEIKKYINKGFIVIDMSTGSSIDETSLNNMIGVSDGFVEDNC